MYMMMLLFGFLHGLVFLPVLLSYVGMWGWGGGKEVGVGIREGGGKIVFPISPGMVIYIGD